MKTIPELRKSGHKVKIQHFRYEKALNPKLIGHILGAPQYILGPLSPEKDLRVKNGHGSWLSEKGGLTKIELTFPDGVIVQTQATCSKQDNFNRKQGVKLCLYRAFGWQTREQRKEHVE